MKDPIRGTFRVTGFYDAHPSSSPPGTRITGVITAPGIPATPAEHKTDSRGRWAGANELPVLVDRADPSRFAILWDEVKPVSWKDQERQAAQAEADRINGRTAGAPDAEGASGGPGVAGVPGTAGGPGVAGGPGAGGFPGSSPFQFTVSPGVTVSPEVAFDDVVTIGPDGQPASLSLPPEVAAQMGEQVGEAIRKALGGLASGTGGDSAAAPYGGFDPAEAVRAMASRSGEQATAVVLAVEDKPTSGFLTPPGGAADLTLEITRADGSVYTTHTVIMFSTPQRRAAIAAVGKRLGVFIAPNNPAKIAIDTTDLF